MAARETAAGDKSLEGAINVGVFVPETQTSSDEGVVGTETGASRQSVSLLRTIWEWKPKPARYDPDDPPKFSLALNILFAFVSAPPRISQSFSPSPLLTKTSISDGRVGYYVHGGKPVL